MTNLADRIEALTGPCRETEEAIHEALGFCNHKRYECYRVQGDSGQTCLDCGIDLYGAKYAPRYLASIDAAMSLKPEKCSVSVQQRRPWEYYWFGLRCHDRHETFEGKHLDPALALAAAAIRAQGE